MKRWGLSRGIRRRRNSPVGVWGEGRDPSTAYARSLFANPHTPLRMTICRGLCLCAAVFLVAISAFGQSASSVNYTVSLASPGQHLVNVQVLLPEGGGRRELQLP